MATNDDGHDGPNFSYAYEGASWNPALRPNTDEDHGLVQTTQQHNATLDHSKGSAGTLEVKPLEQEPVSGASPDPMNSDDDFFERYGAPEDNIFHAQLSSSGPGFESHLSDKSIDGEEHQAGETAETPPLIPPPASSQGQDALREEALVPDESKMSLAGPEDLEEAPYEAHDNYEHQGELTLAEEAVDENVTSPLLANQEVLETPVDGLEIEAEQPSWETQIAREPIQEPRNALDEWGDSADQGFDIGQTSQPDEDPFRPRPVKAPEPTEAVTRPDLHHDPPSDPTGGQVAASRSTAISQVLLEESEETPDHGSNAAPSAEHEDDLAAMWKAALGDDELLDDGMDTGAFFEDDGEGFLDDTADMLTQTEVFSPSQPQPVMDQTGQLKGFTTVGHAASQPRPTTNPYTPVGAQGSAQQTRSIPPSQTIPYSPYGQAPTYGSTFGQQPGRPAASSSSESFVDKNKGGYHSPYDLPEDIVKPKRRAPIQQHRTISQSGPAPPPRSTSMYSNTSAGQSPMLPPPSGLSTASLSPPSSSHSAKAPPAAFAPNGAATRPPAPPSKQASGDFFAELPMVAKPRTSSTMGRYGPQAVPPTPPPPQIPVQQPPPPQTLQRLQTAPAHAPSPLIGGLRPPEKLPPFPENDSPVTRSTSMPMPAPPAPSRYSPAPPPTVAANARYSPTPPAAPPAAPRYSPAPPVQQNRYSSAPIAAPPQPFAPRTSSPLAYATMPEPQDGEQGSVQQPSGLLRKEPPKPDTVAALPSVTKVYSAPSRTASISDLPSASRLDRATSTPPPPQSGLGSSFTSPQKVSRLSYAPQTNQIGASEPDFAPPRRSQTGSPGTVMKKPRGAFAATEVRPGSAHAQVSASATFAPSSPSDRVIAPPISHRRAVSQSLTFIKPTDETALDPLERWKGQPLFKWTSAGTVLVSIPKHTPRYGVGGAVPMVKCTAGEVKTQSAKDFLPLDDGVVKFPGPLKGKGKKKEVIAWLTGKIDSLEKQGDVSMPVGSRLTDDFKRAEEKLMLWKVMLIMVENDGILEGNDAVNKAVRGVLSPGADADENVAGYTAADLLNSQEASGARVRSESMDPSAIDAMRRFLLRGDREKAVWHAVDRRLWGHALLISSTINPDIWKQVIREFVRQEVKKSGRNTESLAALYEIFAGNWDDSIDQLVPASTRAGFQMVSKSDGTDASGNALDGLDRWRETLGLVLSNRSNEDSRALVALGKLLAGYGRTEAAHICFMFARSHSYFAGHDDVVSNLTLVGTNHISSPASLGSNLDSILLSEVYEFALSLSAPNAAAAVAPHLQAYKLHHALILAEYGYRAEAQSYCDAIAAAVKLSTKGSLYYHPSLLTQLDDLNRRLSQSPKDASSSWISKPTMANVSGSMWAKFNSFVAGDDGDDKAAGASSEAGPFAKVAGDTPTMSPVASSTDIYGTMYGGNVPTPAPYPSAPVNSRYAPGGGSSKYAPQRASSYQPASQAQAQQPTNGPYQPTPAHESLYGTYGSSPGAASFDPTPQTPPYVPATGGDKYSPQRRQLQQQAIPSSDPYAPSSADHSPQPSLSYQPTAPQEDEYPAALADPYSRTSLNQVSSVSAFGSSPALSHGFGLPAEPTQDTPSPYEPSTAEEVATSSGGFEPPSYNPPNDNGGYEPPSYQPYEPELEPEEDDAKDEKKPKKKSFMDDDDDDFERKAAELKRKQKEEADRQADEAFRKAAEADAAKDKLPGDKKGWFGGWFGKKDPNAPTAVKAKLGEENSFYYDPDLKRWINKKGGATDSAPTATPPPPKGPSSRSASAGAPTGGLMAPPPPRSVSGSSAPPMGMGPPSGPPSRAATPATGRGDSPAPPLSRDGAQGTPPPLMPPSIGDLQAQSGPPSRPSTAVSNASSIDDLLGPPMARKGAAAKKGKKGRYVDVMAK